MGDTEYVLGLDVGTSSLKALAVDLAGNVLTEASARYPLRQPIAGAAEQDPVDWWRAARKALRAVTASPDVSQRHLLCVGLSGQMHGLVLLDDRDVPVAPCLTWADLRGASELPAMAAAVQPDRLLAITGNPLDAGFTAPKMLYLRHHWPTLFARAHRFLLPKDYLRLRLSGEWATDVSDASATLLFDLHHRRWSPELTEAFAVDERLLPRICESSEVVGRVSSEAAAMSGLPAGTPIVAGGGDVPTAALGLGVLDARGHNGLLGLVTLSTSGQIFVPTTVPTYDPKGRVHGLCHVRPRVWYVMAAILSGGGALEWLSSRMGTGHARLPQLVAEAERSPAGAHGLLFLPYLAGERTPHMDRDARAAFVGLAAMHDREDLVRAVLEGVAFALRDGLSVLRELGVAPARIRFSGGGSRLRLWRQIVADVLGLPAEAGPTSHGSAYGAAILAAEGAGADTTRMIAQGSLTTDELLPDPDAQLVYDELYDAYASLHPRLVDLDHLLAAFARRQYESETPGSAAGEAPAVS